MGNFYACYFGQPLVAFCIFTVLTGFFINFYSAFLNSNTSKHNGFLTFLRETDNARTTVYVISAILSVVMFMTGVVMLLRMLNGISSPALPSSLQISISLKMYLAYPILVLFFYLQPRLFEQRHVKRQLRQKLAEQDRVFDQHIRAAVKYDYSQGLTKVEIDQILSSLFTLQSELPTVNEIKGKRLHSIEQLRKVSGIEEKAKNTMQRLESLQEKEKSVYRFINRAESALFQKTDPNITTILQAIQNLMNSDILKAYEFTLSLEDSPRLRSAR